METRPWYVNQQVNYAFFDFTEMELYVQFNNVSGVKFSETLNTPSLKGFVYYTSSNLWPSWTASHTPLNNLGNNLYSTLISGTFQLGSVIHTKYIPNSGLPINGTTFYVTKPPA